MWKIIGIILILITGFFIASVFRPLLTQLITNASGITDPSDTFALAMLATFGVLPLLWVFVRAYHSLVEKDQ
jgi:hypothetical protein